MAGTRQSLEVLHAKGRKHLTKAEIENRKQTEIKAADDQVLPPTYLNAKQKKRFKAIAQELLDLKIISNLDCDALARLIIVEEEFIAINKLLKKTPLMIKRKVLLYETKEGEPVYKEFEEMTVNPEYDKLQIMRGRAYKECRQGAGDFGLTISHRMRLVVPRAAEPPKENKFEQFRKVK